MCPVKVYFAHFFPPPQRGRRVADRLVHDEDPHRQQDADAEERDEEAPGHQPRVAGDASGGEK